VSGRHHYDVLYARYLEPLRNAGPVRLFEIGLGCDMGIVGASAALWTSYLPPGSAIHLAEYDAACARQRYVSPEVTGWALHTGDQQDGATLARWVADSGGGMDVVVDDGGHTNMQIYASFVALFPRMLRPGGVYVVEDIHCGRHGTWGGGDGASNFLFIDAVTDWVDQLVMASGEEREFYANSQPDGGWRYPLPQGVLSIDCMGEACAITKCTGLPGEWCPVPPRRGAAAERGDALVAAGAAAWEAAKAAAAAAAAAAARSAAAAQAAAAPAAANATAPAAASA
jgi:hypothetical protein